MIALTALVVLCAASGVLSIPFHASCKLDWEFTSKCEEVKAKISNQIKLWNGPAGCAHGGEKCLYALVADSGMKLTATHKTPVKHYTDDLTFTFTQMGSTCKVHGYSTSETWYAVFDYGTNYCNLRNLVTGSGLHKYFGFKETMCTQYSSSNCDQY